MKAEILAGGIREWQKTYGGRFIEWYEENAWVHKRDI
jgi:hypothetical protein